MKLTIKITKEVLEATKMCGTGTDLYAVNENCAVAYAIRKLFPIAKVGRYEISFDGQQPSFSKVRSRLPNAATLFIDEFDKLRDAHEARLLLPEFSFDIEVPDSVIESIGIEQAKEIISKSSTLELIES